MANISKVFSVVQSSISKIGGIDHSSISKLFGQTLPPPSLEKNIVIIGRSVYIQDSTGQVWSWGRNVWGQLGDNTTTGRSSPVSMIGGYIFTKIGGNCGGDLDGPGGGCFIGIKNDGLLMAVGKDNGNGHMAVSPKGTYSSPVSVIGNNIFSKICFAANQNNPSYAFGGALKSDGSAWMWGDNTYGQLGINSASNSYSSPLSVIGNYSFTQLVTGSRQTIALKADGTCWAWGWNQFGSLGDGTTAWRSSPVSVVGNHSFVKIASCCDFAIALKADGTCWAWGYDNNWGCLGQNAVGSNYASPVSVVGNHSFIEIYCGQTYSLALKSDGSAWGWGYNGSGQLGFNNVAAKSSPTSVVGDHSFIKLAAGYTTSIGLKSDGSVWSWGANEYGQLGTGNTTARSSPVSVIKIFS